MDGRLSKWNSSGWYRWEDWWWIYSETSHPDVIIFSIYIGSAGSLLNELYTPIGIALDVSTGDIYIADSINNRIVKYSTGSTTGVLVAGGNGAGASTNQLNQPNGVYFDSSSNSLIIANTLAHNIVRWTVGASTGTVIAGSSSGAIRQYIPAIVRAERCDDGFTGQFICCWLSQ